MKENAPMTSVVLELPEAGLDVVCMDDNVPVRECDSEIP